MKHAVRLTKVNGDQEDFADLIGTKGELHIENKLIRYFPKNNGDFVEMTPQQVIRSKSKIKVKTTLENTFTFALT